MVNLYNEPKNDLISEFNDAKGQLFRLSNLWNLFNDYLREGKLEDAKWILDRIWGELTADAIIEGGEDLNNNKFFLKTHILNLKVAIAEKKQDRPFFYQSLQAKEVFLRFLQDTVGKGAKRSRGDDDDFEE